MRTQAHGAMQLCPLPLTLYPLRVRLRVLARACPDLHGKAGESGLVMNHEGMGGCMVRDNQCMEIARMGSGLCMLPTREWGGTLGLGVDVC